MEDIEEILREWQSTLCKKVDAAALYSRNPVAHKWKVLLRSAVLRELVAWRLLDLLASALELQKNERILGGRILLRAALETLAILVYLNERMQAVVHTGRGFDDFSGATARLMLGSRNRTTAHESINILTVLAKCDSKYDGIKKIYEDLCESAHPNWEGVCLGYSEIDHENYTTTFGNGWMAKFGSRQRSIFNIIMLVFDKEYNEVWPAAFEALETWIEENDANLQP